MTIKITQSQFIEKVNLIRGEYLFFWIPIEYMIHFVIARYYCTDKKKVIDLDTLLVESKDMRAKILALKNIMDKALPDKKENKKFTDNIFKKYELRNHFAHHLVELPKADFSTPYFNFISQGGYGSNQERKIVGHYDMGKHIEIIKEMQEITNAFVQVLQSVEK